MNRRSFVSALAAAPAASVRHRALEATVPSPHPPIPPSPQAGELDEATITQLQAWMQQGRYSSRDLASKYLERISTLDRRGPMLRAVLETNPDALRLAEQLDAERRAGRVRGPLHGVPVVVKDNVDTADRMHTSAGSLALEQSIAAADATIAAKLREAGAVLLAKTNMSEWANFRSTHSVSGWSGRGGQCRNPYVLDRSPSGSSSGTGTAVAANLCAAGIGTETDGSITSPAAAAMLVGHKPTVGLVSRAGIIPISATQDTAGPMARTVEDAAILLSAIAGVDARDPATARAAAHLADYRSLLNADALRGARLGVARKRYSGYNAHVDALFDQALGVLRQHGAVLVDPADVTTEDRLQNNQELAVLLYEFKAGLNGYLRGLGESAPVKSLADVIAFNERERTREMPWFAQELFIQAQAKGALTAPAYRNALAACRRASRTLGIDGTMNRHRLDAIICPTQAPVWPIDPINGDSFGGNCTTPAAVAGYPHVTVPMGLIVDLPVGLSFFGRAWSDGKLLSYAYAYEQASRARRAPSFKPSLSADL